MRAKTCPDGKLKKPEPFREHVSGADWRARGIYREAFLSMLSSCVLPMTGGFARTGATRRSWPATMFTCGGWALHPAWRHCSRRPPPIDPGSELAGFPGLGEAGCQDGLMENVRVGVVHTIKNRVSLAMSFSKKGRCSAKNADSHFEWWS